MIQIGQDGDTDLTDLTDWTDQNGPAAAQQTGFLVGRVQYYVFMTCKESVKSV